MQPQGRYDRAFLVFTTHTAAFVGSPLGHRDCGSRTTTQFLVGSIDGYLARCAIRLSSLDMEEFVSLSRSLDAVGSSAAAMQPGSYDPSGISGNTDLAPGPAIAPRQRSQSQYIQSIIDIPLPSSNSALPANIPESSPESSRASPQDLRRRKSDSDPSLMNPFKDCIGSFGVQQRPLYSCPADGRVNGYVKFNWLGGMTYSFPDTASSVIWHQQTDEEELSSSDAEPVSIGSAAVPVALSTALVGTARSRNSQLEESSPELIHPSRLDLQFSATPDSMQNEPQYLPQHFGFQAKMGRTDRKLWDFYVNNWCPGRSILKATNFWHQDFARMHSMPAVLAAIQCLAGVYIYDYFPLEIIRQRVNDNFTIAMTRLTTLLGNPALEHGDEVITLSILLSMQDIILTERRVKKPDPPRWLLGFQHGEHFLQITDQGSRFWKVGNVQLGSLRSSHCVVIGRHLILTQSMTALPPPAEFDPEYEAARFGWLLYGSKADAYEIHGGCGFSKKLLHVVGQITYCTARLQQEPESLVVPTTARFLYKELREMRQWSPEIGGWDVVMTGPSVLDTVRSMQSGQKISESAQMTAVTAEAWRIAAMLYLQCRLLRLPRDDPAVMSNLNDLTQCINAMPTSGSIFTAQAPLFPVFLLGLLSTAPKHRKVSQTWFEQVVQTPVRSSVPPLYASLRKIWTWLDVEFPPSPPGTSKRKSPQATQQLNQRRPWWEDLITRIREKEDEETLCLT